MLFNNCATQWGGKRILYNDGGYNRKRALTLNIFLSTKTKAKHQLQIKLQTHQSTWQTFISQVSCWETIVENYYTRAVIKTPVTTVTFGKVPINQSVTSLKMDSLSCNLVIQLIYSTVRKGTKFLKQFSTNVFAAGKESIYIIYKYYLANLENTLNEQSA